MNSETLKFVVHQVGDRIGLAVGAKLSTTPDGQNCDCIPADGHPNESFTVQFQLRWRSAEAVFVPGRFSAPLIRQMGNASAESKAVFASFARALEAKRIKTQMRVNGIPVNACDASSLSGEWNRLELSLRTPPMVIEERDEALHERLIMELVVPFFGMMATLIGVEDNEPETTGENEGRPVQSLTNRYERKKVNREACIQLKGSRCLACGFDFAETYGPIGIGYIEVHHSKPVASVGKEYQLNVETDLVPLCANCHAMSHREEPPIPLEQLRQFVTDRRRASKEIN